MSNKKKYITFRVTDDEKKLISLKADKAEKRISDYIRDLVLFKDDNTIKNIEELNKKIQELTIYIHRSASNINQIRQIKNSKIYDDDIKNKLVDLTTETKEIFDLFLDCLNDFYNKKNKEI